MKKIRVSEINNHKLLNGKRNKNQNKIIKQIEEMEERGK
jgi:hypothetical protein